MLSKCFITDAHIQKVTNTDFEGIFYRVDYDESNFYFKFNWDHSNSDFVEKNKHILQGLIINRKFQYDRENNFYGNDRLQRIINEAAVPKTPKSKLDNLIVFLFSQQESEGGVFNIGSKLEDSLLIKKLYFKNEGEFLFYIKTLRELRYIEFNDSAGNSISSIRHIKFTFAGLEYVIDIQESGNESKKCFIAMSFSQNMTELRKTLKSALRDSGYEPILVDELHFESDITINDAIISNIKKSKFLIADFTEQKHGVYFEAGYALGKDKPVIYTCHESDFSKTHFDTNHYPHIVYKDYNDLKQKLKFKISAWID